jgi:hypothetical protein
MSLRKQVRSKIYMDEIFATLGLDERVRYGRQEFKELGEEIGVKYVGGIGTAAAIELSLSIEDEEEIIAPTGGTGGDE